MIAPSVPPDRTRRTTAAQDATTANPPLALTTSHIPPRGRLTLARGGTLAELRGRIGPQPPARGPGWYGMDGNGAPLLPPVRGPIKGHSKRARSRQMRWLASIDRSALLCMPLFMTLTYPASWSEDPRRWDRDLEALWKRIERKWPAAGMTWRLEFQVRGAPHFHCLIFNVPFIDKHWLAQAWYEVVGSGDMKHRRRGSRIEKCQSWGKVVSYVSKYLAKVADPCNSAHIPEGVGRHWGVKNASAVPRNLEHIDLDDWEFHKVRRVLRALARARGRHWTCYGRWSGGWTFVSDDTMDKIPKILKLSDRWLEGW